MQLSIRKIKPEKAPLDLLYSADPSREAVSDYISRGDIFAAFLGTELVGISVLIRTRPFTMELVNLSVKEEHQRKGIGSSLIINAIEAARNSDCRILELGTGNAGIGQLKLYQKHGFQMTGVDIDFFRKFYPEKIFENDMECRHMVRLSMDL